MDLERLGVHLGDADEGANHLHVPLRRVGMLSASLEMISSKPDSLIEHGEFVEGHVGTRSERDEIVRKRSQAVGVRGVYDAGWSASCFLTKKAWIRGP